MPDTVMSHETTSERNQSLSVAKLAEALAQAQKAFAPIPKDREVTVHSDRGSYKFKYATLDAIRGATMPALAEHSIAIVQGMVEQGNGYAVETKLMHASGEWVRNVTPMFVSGRVKDGRQYPPTNQELGSAQSYARRYGLSALLCITADEDDDGNTADGNHIEGSQRVPYRPVPTHRNGVRQASAAGARMAAEEPEAVARAGDRMKGTMPNGTGKKSAAEKAKEWTDNAIQTLNLSGQTAETLSKFYKDNGDKIAWLETNAPDQHERFVVAYDNAQDAVKGKVAA